MVLRAGHMTRIVSQPARNTKLISPGDPGTREVLVSRTNAQTAVGGTLLGMAIPCVALGIALLVDEVAVLGSGDGGQIAILSLMTALLVGFSGCVLLWAK